MKLLLLLLFAHLTVFAQTPTPTPLPLTLTVPYAADTTASQEMIRFITPTGTHNGVTHHPFQFYQRTTVFGNDRTDSVGWGFAPAGDVQSAPSLVFLMEDSFGHEPTSPENFELHLQLASTEGGISRPWTWTFDRKTGETIAVTEAVSHFYSGGSELHVGPVENLSQGPFRVRGDSVTFETLANGGANAQQIRITPSPLNAATSQLQFGQGPNPALVNNGANGLRLYRYGTANAPFFAGSFTAYGDDGNTPKVEINGSGIKVNGVAGVMVSGSICTITEIRGGIITAATCVP